MNSTEPPLDWRKAGRAGDDLDGLLRAFYRSEMPEPWPEWRRPEDRSRATLLARPRSSGARRLGTAVRSRLALAAAVVGLLVGTLLLSGQFRLSPDETRYGPTTAKKYWEQFRYLGPSGPDGTPASPAAGSANPSK
jgi:hypothetical protein